MRVNEQEGECFAAAARLDTHKALVHIFFAQRSTKKVKGITDAGEARGNDGGGRQGASGRGTRGRGRPALCQAPGVNRALRGVAARAWLLGAGLKARPIKVVAVLGGGLMGSGIATALVLAGVQVLLKEVNQTFLDVSSIAAHSVGGGGGRAGCVGRTRGTRPSSTN